MSQPIANSLMTVGEKSVSDFVTDRITYARLWSIGIELDSETISAWHGSRIANVFARYHAYLAEISQFKWIEGRTRPTFLHSGQGHILRFLCNEFGGIGV